MPAATSKCILFATSRHDRKVMQHPVAVFANVKEAKTYATYLRLAYRAGDVDAVKALDPEVHLTSEGALIPDTKWAAKDVRYGPMPAFPEDDAATEEGAATS